jgi:hypothetical protein
VKRILGKCGEKLGEMGEGGWQKGFMVGIETGKGNLEEEKGGM